MSFRYCRYLIKRSFVINGRIDVPGAPVNAFCCEMINGMPVNPFDGTPEQILRNYMGMSALITAECETISDDSKRVYTAGCLNCVNFLESDEPVHCDSLIHSVNFSAYPAVCQCNCFYCWVHQWDERITPAAREGYEKLFATLELAERCGVIAPDAGWQISSGEIAIHYYRKRIMDLVKSKTVRFLTNCIKFDKDIAQNLRDNPKSKINLSIDSGTSETWKKVKGVDNFETVMENLTKYYVSTTTPGQIELKYIVFPDINDNYEDYLSLMEIMKVLNVNCLSISRDGRKKYSADSEELVKLIGATAYLVAMCRKNGFEASMSPFSEKEKELIELQVDEIMQRDLI